MPNTIKLLELLKWNTDKDHPITQEKLREIPGANECMGYKTTFKRNLFSIANVYNNGKEKKDWKIVFPGYQQNNTNNDSKRNYTGPIYYNHEITSNELDFLIQQVQTTNIFTTEQKKSLSERLIHALASKYYETPTSTNIKEIIDFTNNESELLNTNLPFIQNAIKNKKMIEFTPNRLNHLGKLTSNGSHIMVSPYKIIFYKGIYYLLGNQRIGKFHSYQRGDYIKYSNTLDMYRIDRMTRLGIAKETYEKKAKYFWGIENKIDLLSNRILACKEGIKIESNTISKEYGKIEFEILWDYFPSSQKHDFSFIQDTFGNNYTVSTDKDKTIVSVQATEECFIDFALLNVDKIIVTNSTDLGIVINNRIKAIINESLKILNKNLKM